MLIVVCHLKSSPRPDTLRYTRRMCAMCASSEAWRCLKQTSLCPKTVAKLGGFHEHRGNWMVYWVYCKGDMIWHDMTWLLGTIQLYAGLTRICHSNCFAFCVRGGCQPHFWNGGCSLANQLSGTYPTSKIHADWTFSDGFLSRCTYWSIYHDWSWEVRNTSSPMLLRRERHWTWQLPSPACWWIIGSCSLFKDRFSWLYGLVIICVYTDTAWWLEQEHRHV